MVNECMLLLIVVKSFCWVLFICFCGKSMVMLNFLMLVKVCVMVLLVLLFVVIRIVRLLWDVGLSVCIRCVMKCVLMFLKVRVGL